MKLNIEVTATDNKRRTGIDAEIAIAKLTGYAMSRCWFSDDSSQHLEVIKWAAYKLVEIGVVDPAAAAQHIRKQEDNFVTMHMKKYDRMRQDRLRRQLWTNEIKNTYVRSRFNFYKDRLPEDVARAQARHEFGKLVLRLKQWKIPNHAIATRFEVSVEAVRHAGAKTVRKQLHRHRSPIEFYFEYRDFV